MGLFRVTLLPVTRDDLPIVLCDSGDPLPTFNIRLNTQPIYEYRHLAFADFATAFFRGNRRNILSFGVTRAKDDRAKPFLSTVQAMIYALTLSSRLPGITVAKIELRDSTGAGTFYMQNAAVDQAELVDVKGVKLGYQFALNGGEIRTKP